ncbi:MAG: PASTA domain-containing protein [Sporichthyaceae bacterium]
MADHMPRGAAASYRLRISLTAAGALGVVALVAATTALLDTDKTLRVDAPAAGIGLADAPALEIPDGFRLVGFGDVAIEVPESWGTNAARCGTPERDTVEIDVGGVRGCLAPRPAGVESVSVFRVDPDSDMTAGRPIEIEGRSAQRVATRCEDEPDPGADPSPVLCSGTVWFPTEGVGFRAESSTGASEVDEILDRVRVVPGFVGVPGWRDNQIDDQEFSQESYVAELEAAGFVAEVRTEHRPGISGGHILDAQPAPGTVARPGETIVVTAVAPARGPADEG